MSERGVATVRLDDTAGHRNHGVGLASKLNQAINGLGRARAWWLTGVLAGSLLVLVVGFVHPFAVYAPTFRATLETVIALCALTGAAILGWRFARTHLLRDLLLMAALLAAGLLELTANLLPAALGLQSVDGRAALASGLPLVALAFVAAGRAPADRLVARPQRADAIAVYAGTFAVLLALTAGIVGRGALGLATGAPAYGVRAGLAHPLSLVLVLIASVAFADAAAAFASRERRAGRGFEFVAAALILLAVSQLCYLALPTLGSDWIAPPEGSRVVAFGLLLAAIVRAELGDRQRLAGAAASTERRRVARDLHDGLAQDLAFIAANSAQIAHQLGTEHPVAVAASRALALVRETISDLSLPHDATSREALEAVALEQHDRFGIVVDVDASPDVEFSPSARDDVARIAREAIANAARHGGAGTVVVSLTRREGGTRLLRIRDDGCGIAGGHLGAAPDGFGLHSMRERVAGLGGQLSIRRLHGCGTELEVLLP